MVRHLMDMTTKQYFTPQILCGGVRGKGPYDLEEMISGPAHHFQPWFCFSEMNGGVGPGIVSDKDRSLL